MTSLPLPLPLTFLLVGTAAAQAPIEVQFTTVPGQPSQAVPGVAFAFFQNFHMLAVSPSGNHWTLHASSTGGSCCDEYLFVDGLVELRETITTLPWNSAGVWGGGFGDVDDAGTLLVHSNADGRVVEGLNLGASWSFLQSSSDPAPGVPGATLGTPVSLSASSGAGFLQVNELDGLGGSGAPPRALYRGGQLELLVGVTVPPGQSGTNGTLSNLLTTRILEASENGDHYIVRAGLNNSAGTVVLVDGTVALQQGTVIPGLNDTHPILHFSGVSMNDNGSWMAWGRNAQFLHNWVLQDGAVLAEGGDPIVPGSSEIWGWPGPFVGFSSFTAALSNSAGDTLVCGSTLSGTGVFCVKNGVEVVLTPSTPIDLDGNGAFDDDAFFGAFEAVYDWCEDGMLWAMVTVRSAGGVIRGEAIVKIDLGGGSLGTVYCQSAPNSTGSQAELTFTGTASVAANDLVLGVDSLPTNSFGYFLGSTAQASLPGAGGSQGTLCLGGSIGRAVGGSILNSGSSGAVSILANLTALPTPTGPVMGMAGETWSFQYWYRDANPATTSNLTPGVSVVLN